MASPTPVLPEVGSTIVPPGLSFPSRSAASIIGSPIRSFTEPPGFRYSSFASICAPPLGLSLSRRTTGVRPTSSRIVGYSPAIPGSVDHRSALSGCPASGRVNRRLHSLELAPADERRRCDDGNRTDRGEHPEGERKTARLRAWRVVAARKQRVRMRERHSRGDRDTESTADLLRGVDQA